MYLLDVSVSPPLVCHLDLYPLYNCSHFLLQVTSDLISNCTMCSTVNTVWWNLHPFVFTGDSC